MSVGVPGANLTIPAMNQYFGMVVLGDPSTLVDGLLLGFKQAAGAAVSRPYGSPTITPGDDMHIF